MITRTVTAQILKNLTVFPAANIIGPRQVGKTTLAKFLQTRLGKPTVFLDLQKEQDFDKLAAPGLFLREHEDKCVIIDEIQRMPGLYSVLRSIIDEKRKPARFVLLGSASPAIIKGVSESLAGRVFFTELMPFSLPEVAGQTSWQKLWIGGGFPDAMQMPDEDLRTEWFDSFIQTFVERDLPEFGYSITPMLASRLLRMLAHQNGQLLNVTHLANAMDISTPYLNRYLDLLEGGFMIQRLMPWYVNTGKRLVKSPKIYVRDSGILHHLLRIRHFDALLGNPALGASWEGFVIEQVMRVTQRKWEYCFYRTQHGAEADLLLISPSGVRYAVEIKFSEVPVLSKGFYSSITDLKPNHSFVVIPHGESYPKPGGIRVISLPAFLEHLLTAT